MAHRDIQHGELGILIALGRSVEQIYGACFLQRSLPKSTGERSAALGNPVITSRRWNRPHAGKGIVRTEFAGLCPGFSHANENYYTCFKDLKAGIPFHIVIFEVDAAIEKPEVNFSIQKIC
jgi:hypothetical protein